MTKAQHTPGPWMLSEHKMPMPEIVPQMGGLTICACYSHNSDVEANARLIAAAPELLEALLIAASLIGTMSKERWSSRVSADYDFILAAIAKARGES